MKVLGTIKNVIIVIISVIFFGFALFVTVLLLNFNQYGVTQFNDTSVVVLKEKVSSDEYQKGDVVLVEAFKANEFEIGETVFTYRVDNGVAHIEIGKVGEIYENEKSLSFENGDTYSEKFIIGKPGKVYKKVGTFLGIVESKWGFLFIVLVPCFLLFIYQIYALIIEIKYGGDDED